MARLAFHLGAADPRRSVTVRVAAKLHWTDLVRMRAIAVGDSELIPTWVARAFAHVFDVDFDTNPRDGWELARLATTLAVRRPASGRKAAALRFQAFAHRQRQTGKSRAYLLGTGPSLASAKDVDFADGIVVACNTIVRDRDLWNHVRASVLVAGDAIYHFGHTPHARAFRADAAARIRESGGDTVFVYPETFDPVVRAEFVGLEDSLVPIPVGEHHDVTVDLTTHFALPDLGNVLNLLLLPVGASLSRNIWLWGFDGRAPADVLFWANSSRHSYSDLMPGLRQAHPAFFRVMVPSGRESKYVESVHGDDLDRQMEDAERRGFTFNMMHFSWTPTLSKRSVSVFAPPQRGDEEAGRIVG
jgi:hypothetical protein